MISLTSRWAPPANQAQRAKHEHAGDGYIPAYDYGRYELLAYAETPIRQRNPGQGYPPAYTDVPNYRPGLAVTKGLQTEFMVSTADAVRRPGIVGTAPPGVDPRTTWAPQYTIQQAAIQTALAQKRTVN